jgi:putative photosynthetic complex assembly protein
MSATTLPPGRDVFPRAALWIGAIVLGLTLGGVALHRLSPAAGARAEDAQAIAQRALIFRDLPDGGVVIVDAATGRTLDTAHGEQGFLRGTLRAMARERRLQGAATDAPLQLIARADGRLTLADASTGARIDLESFGPTNAAVFAQWLAPGEKP